MKQLMSSKLFSLLSENSVNENCLTKLKQAYEEFASTLLNKLQEEKNITKLYYNLGFVRLELVGIRDMLYNGQGKKCLKNNK